jgi:alanine racemase
MKIATLPVGYSDGVTMEPAERLIKLGGSNRYWGLLRGHEVPFVGRAGIAHILVDVSSVPSVKIGEEVAVPVRRTAASARLPRIYKVRR